MTQRVLVDANVLFSRTLRDWLYHLRAESDGMFQLHTTEAILTEVKYHLLKQHPNRGGEEISRVHERIVLLTDEVVDAFPDDAGFTGTDVGDRHVHAAAVHSRADILLTNNAPGDIATVPQHYEILDADAFFCLVADSSPSAFAASVRGQFDFWCAKKRERAAALDERLLAAGCADFALRVTEELRRIAID